MEFVALKCLSCHHEWVPRVSCPLKCPVCQRPLRKGDSELDSERVVRQTVATIPN